VAKYHKSPGQGEQGEHWQCGGGVFEGGEWCCFHGFQTILKSVMQWARLLGSSQWVVTGNCSTLPIESEKYMKNG
jgi:hypothetical protein